MTPADGGRLRIVDDVGPGAPHAPDLEAYQERQGGKMNLPLELKAIAECALAVSKGLRQCRRFNCRSASQGGGSKLASVHRHFQPKRREVAPDPLF